MEVVSSILGALPWLWDKTAIQVNYIRKLQENLTSLGTSLDKLKDLRDTVKKEVEDAENNPIMKRTALVAGWLRRVESEEREVTQILQDGSQQVEKCSVLTGCFCCCRRKNCYTGYELGKIVIQKLDAVDKLKSEGVFSDVVDRCISSGLVQEIPTTNQVVGMDSMLDEIWRLVNQEDQIRIIGLYGMGGVGKTALLTLLNNEFLKKDRHNFDLVLWVVVSKDPNLQKLQKDIAASLGLESWSGEGDLDRGAKDIFNVLSKKKFVLLLDDIWERLDLRKIGIPTLDTRSEYACGSSHGAGTMSKVVFTTRYEKVCGSMEAKGVRVDCLKWNEAWSLFQEKVGQEALSCHPKVPKLAKIVAEKCSGLPLALISVGLTMASKKTVQEWEHGISMLKRSASLFSGMVDEVLPILKFSYDNLKNEKIRKCFLYCSLYPEDFPISKKELIDLWIGEGFLNEFDDIEEARNEGHDVIGCLLGACLLESVLDDDENKVRMHDVVRDLAIWIASDFGTNKDKFLVVKPASNEPKLDDWEKAERISLINYQAEAISEAPNCLNLSTLMLQHNTIRTLPDDFFKCMPVLKVLNMYYSYIIKVPTSITSLIELEYLNLSGTFARLKPGWLRSFVKMKYLDLSGTALKITPGEIASLSKLQMLDLFRSGSGNWEIEGGPSLRELEGLKRLNYLGISIATCHALKMFVSSHKLQKCTRRLQICCIDHEQSDSITSISLSTSLHFSSPPSFISLSDMIYLKQLYISDCPELEELSIMVNWVAEDEHEKITLLTTMEILQIVNIPKLKIVWDIVLQPHHKFCCFTNLQAVYISYCDALKDVSWLVYAQVLEKLDLGYLGGLEDVISDGFSSPSMVQLLDEKYYSSNTVIFSRLKTLKLFTLPNLKSICVHPLAFPCLESISIWDCPQLKKLPLDTKSANKNTLRQIRGDREWWKSLEWEDESIKSTFLPYFSENYKYQRSD